MRGVCIFNNATELAAFGKLNIGRAGDRAAESAATKSDRCGKSMAGME